MTRRVPKPQKPVNSREEALELSKELEAAQALNKRLRAEVQELKDRIAGALGP